MAIKAEGHLLLHCDRDDVSKMADIDPTSSSSSYDTFGCDKREREREGVRRSVGTKSMSLKSGYKKGYDRFFVFFGFFLSVLRRLILFTSNKNHGLSRFRKSFCEMS
jgi:hypothetical protein